MKLLEYQKHITAVAPKSYCGVNVSAQFAFTSMEHAFAELARRGRLLPCPKCWIAIADGESMFVPRDDLTTPTSRVDP